MSAQLEQIDSSTALAPAQRDTDLASSALLTIEPTKYVAAVFEPFRSKLAAAKEEAQSAVYHVRTPAGMAIALKHRAAFRAIRVEAEKARKDRKAPILEIGKLLDGRYKELEAEISPFEEKFDHEIKAEESRKEAERQAKVAAERVRVEAIQARLAQIRNLPVSMTGKSSEEIGCEIYRLVHAVPDASFEEFEEQAKAARLEALDKLAKMEAEQRGVEIQQEAARQEAERQRLEQEEEAARLKAEREELARLRVEQQAQLAAERAEAERVRKLEDDARAFKQQQEREELERQNAAMRLERAKLAEQQAAMDATRRAFEELEHAEAERVRQQAAADQAAEEARKPAPVKPTEAAAAARPADEDIIRVVADHFGVPVDLAYGWLIEMSRDLEYH